MIQWSGSNDSSNTTEAIWRQRLTAFLYVYDAF